MDDFLEYLGVLAMGLLGVAVFFIFLVGLFSLLIGTEIQSPTPITPELEISIKNGVSDTTFIYKENN